MDGLGRQYKRATKLHSDRKQQFSFPFFLLSVRYGLITNTCFTCFCFIHFTFFKFDWNCLLHVSRCSSRQGSLYALNCQWPFSRMLSPNLQSKPEIWGEWNLISLEDRRCNPMCFEGLEVSYVCSSPFWIRTHYQQCHRFVQMTTFISIIIK